jgi:hypothetical protein
LVKDFIQSVKTAAEKRQLLAILTGVFFSQRNMGRNMGLSENSVPLNPLDYRHFPYQNSYLGVYCIFRHTHMGSLFSVKRDDKLGRLSSKESCHDGDLPGNLMEMFILIFR